MNDILIEDAVKIAKKLIRPLEGLELRAYPDPSSALSKTLSTHGKLNLYKAGKFDIPEEWEGLSPNPVTIGYGCTKNVKLEDVWTLDKAEEELGRETKERVLDVLKSAPKLTIHSAEKLAACVSLHYNIGSTAFRTSTTAKCIAADDMYGASRGILLWNKETIDGKMVVSPGLVSRRKVEYDLFTSVKG